MIGNIKGLIKILKFEKDFPVFFDRSVQGFWQSAVPAILYLPLYLYILMTAYEALGIFDKGADFLHVLVVEAMAYVLVWLVFPLMIYSIFKQQKKLDQFFHVMVPYKWTDGLQLLYGGIVLLLSAVNLLPQAMVQSLAVLVNMLLLANKFFVVRQTYAEKAASVVGFILIEVFVVVMARMIVGVILKLPQV